MRLFWNRAGAVARKEVFHILRDPFALAASLGLPVLMVIIFGVSIEFNMKDIPLAVNDADQTRSSRMLLDRFASSGYFGVRRVVSPQQGIAELTDQKARAALVIPPDFESELISGRQGQLQLLIDGSDNSTVGPVSNYVNRIVGAGAPALYDLRARYLFNPELDSRWFVIPGLTVVIMAILSILLTALTIAREWENGSMELLLSTPVRPVEIIVGKLAPYGVLGVIAIAFVYVIARAVFQIPFVGNLAVFGLGSLLFLVTYLAQGLLISVVARNQQVAMQLAMVTGMLPSNLISGFIFPIESMPAFFQYLTMLLPARWFMRIARDTFLQGSGLIELKVPFLALTFLCFAMIFLATRKFKRDLEP